MSTSSTFIPGDSEPPRGGDALPAEAANAAADARLGKFIRTELLGAGAMGEVWKAWDTALSRWVALKLLKTHGESEAALFRREALLAGRLSHPNIAAIYEVGEDSGRPYIAMQWIDGRTLKAFSPGDRRGLVRLVRDAARALGYAHLHGVVHRDLKPTNLMFCRPPQAQATGLAVREEYRVYVMDFGLARPTREASDRSLTGGLVGTPGFMPPEQARGDDVDGRADVYALGATLYQLLTGHAPVEGGGTVYDYLVRVQEQDPTPPRDHQPSLDRDLEKILLKCLEKEPARRYETAERLADDLDRWLDGEPVRARPLGLAGRLLRRVRRNPRTVAALAVLLVASTVAVAAFARHALRASARADARRTASTLLAEAELRASRARDNYYRFGGPFDAFRAEMLAAAEIASRAHDADPAFPAPLDTAGACLLEAGEPPRARAAWRRALEIDPADTAANLALAESAIEDLTTLLISHESNTDVRLLLARPSRQILERHLDALAAGGAVEPGVKRLLGGLRIILEGRGEEAALYFEAEAAGSAQPARMWEWAALAWSLTPTAESRARITRAADQALNLNASDPNALFLSGYAARMGCDADAALQFLDRAIARNPRFARARFARAMVRYHWIHDAWKGAPKLDAEEFQAAWFEAVPLIEADLAGALEVDPNPAFLPSRAQFHFIVALRDDAFGRATDLSGFDRVTAEYDEVFRIFGPVPWFLGERAGNHYFAALSLQRRAGDRFAEVLPDFERRLLASLADYREALPTDRNAIPIYFARTVRALLRSRLEAGGLDLEEARRQLEESQAMLRAAIDEAPNEHRLVLALSRNFAFVEDRAGALRVLEEARDSGRYADIKGASEDFAKEIRTLNGSR
ncbi:MAG: protein kinase [Planctomycetes bacterium]|nr:protein kinase [Planctomycetota bacterium]